MVRTHVYEHDVNILFSSFLCCKVLHELVNYEIDYQFPHFTSEVDFSILLKAPQLLVTWRFRSVDTDFVGNLNPYEWKGVCYDCRSAAKLEWGFTYWLVKDEEGFATKEAIRGIYDGSIFDYIEKEIKEGKNKDKKVELQKIDPKNMN